MQANIKIKMKVMCFLYFVTQFARKAKVGADMVVQICHPTASPCEFHRVPTRGVTSPEPEGHKTTAVAVILRGKNKLLE